jgi:hypothetical protein
LLRTVHNKEKKFVCSWPECGKAFGLSGNLKKHISEIHEQVSMIQNVVVAYTSTSKKKIYIYTKISSFDVLCKTPFLGPVSVLTML